MRFLVTGAAAALTLSATATAQFSEGFESYAAGSAIEGQGGWHNWDTCTAGNRAYNTVTNTRAASGSNSLRMIGSMDPVNGNLLSDTVREFPGQFTSGVWEFTCQTYIPSTFFGEGWVILLNTFADCGGPYNWSTQVQFDSVSLNVQPIAPFGTSAGTFVDLTGLGGGTPYLVDQWVEVKAIIDLDLDTVTVSYGGTDMYTHQWTEAYGAGSVAQIGTLDLFCGTNDTTDWYVDDISIAPAAAGSIGTNYCTANANSTGVAGAISAAGSTVASANDVTLTASNMPPGQFGIFVTSKTQAFTPGVGSGNLCVGGNIGRYQQPGQIQQIDANGQFSYTIDTNFMPQGAGLVPVVPGETWNFQAWHRDFTTTPPVTNTSNLSNGLAITFS